MKSDAATLQGCWPGGKDYEGLAEGPAVPCPLQGWNQSMAGAAAGRGFEHGSEDCDLDTDQPQSCGVTLADRDSRMGWPLGGLGSTASGCWEAVAGSSSPFLPHPAPPA